MGCAESKEGSPPDKGNDSFQRQVPPNDEVDELLVLCDMDKLGALEGFYAGGGDPNVRCKNTEYSTTMLVYAATANKIRVVDFLLTQAHTNVNMGDEVSNTALMLSAWKGNEEIVAMLLRHPRINVDMRGFGVSDRHSNLGLTDLQKV